ncbi:hypothetical protein ACQEU6_14625 [Spirillospora sp. CA-108201]
MLGDPSGTRPRLRNFARDTFPSGGDGPCLSHWPVHTLDQEAVESALVSDLRRATGRFPESARLRDLIRELAAGSERFAALWAAGAVGAHWENRKIVEHPSVGPVTVDCDVMTDGDADRKIVVLTAAPGEQVGWTTVVGRARRALQAMPDETVLAGLSMGAGVVGAVRPGRPDAAGVLLLHAPAVLPASATRVSATSTPTPSSPTTTPQRPSRPGPECSTSSPPT